MGETIHDIFGRIHAEEALKQKTASFLISEMQKGSKAAKVGALRYAAAFAVFAVTVFAAGFSYHLYNTPDAYIDIDVNPSVELSVNRFGRVIMASPYNDESVFEISDMRHSPYKEAVKEILSLMANQGYLDKDGLLSLTVQAATSVSESKIMDGLTATVNSVLQDRGSDTEAEIFPVTREVKNYACEHHVSPARYLAVTELLQVDPAASFGSCSKHSISELRRLARGDGGNHHAGDSAVENDTSQNGHKTGGHGNGRHGKGH